MNLQRAARIVWPFYVGFIFATLSVARVASDWLRARNLLRLTVVSLFVLAVVALLGFLLRQPRFRTWRLPVVLLVLAGCYGLAAIPSDTPEERLHLIEYGGVALLSELALPASLGGWKRFHTALLITVAVGWSDELVQGLLPTRHYDIHDVELNALSGFLALSGKAALERFGVARPASTAVPGALS